MGERADAGGRARLKALSARGERALRWLGGRPRLAIPLSRHDCAAMASDSATYATAHVRLADPDAEPLTRAQAEWTAGSPFAPPLPVSVRV